MNTDPIPSAGLAATLGTLRGASAPAAGASATTSLPASTPAPAPAPAPALPTATTGPVAAARAAAEAAQAQAAAAEINTKLAAANVPLQYQVELNNQGDVRSIKLYDVQTNQVVMQIPSDAMLAIRDSVDKMIAAHAKGEPIAGALFSKSA